MSVIAQIVMRILVLIVVFHCTVVLLARCIRCSAKDTTRETYMPKAAKATIAPKFEVTQL